MMNVVFKDYVSGKDLVLATLSAAPSKNDLVVIHKDGTEEHRMVMGVEFHLHPDETRIPQEHRMVLGVEFCLHPDETRIGPRALSFVVIRLGSPL